MSKISGLFTNALNFLENVSQTFSAPTAPEKSKAPLSNDAWVKNLVEQTNFGQNDLQKTTGEQKFWVEKSLDPKILRERLPRENFHYDTNDIAAYEKKTGEPFVITDAGKCSAAENKELPCEWAKPKDIKNWETVNGKVSITLPADRIKELRDFRQGRVIDKAVAGISDPVLRENVKKDLLQIATGSGQDRIDATVRLINLNNPNQADLDKVRQAIKAVVEQPENRNNPLTNLVAGKIKLDEIAAKIDQAQKFVGPIDANAFNQALSKELFDAEYQIEKAAKSASGVDNLTGKVDVSKINRQEAAWVNKQVATILQQTGNVAMADYREKLGRFFESDDKERKTATFSRTIDRWQEGAPLSMRASTAEEIERMNAPEIETPAKIRNLKEDPQKREWKIKDLRTEDGKFISDGRGGTVQTGYSRFNIKGSMREVGTELLTTTVYRDRNGKEVNPNKGGYYLKSQESIRLTYEGPERNTGGPARAAAVGGAVSGIGQWNEAMKFGADLRYNTTRKKLDLREKMEKADFDATHYRVPPEPEKLPQEREKLVKMYGTSKEMEVKINQMMNELEEASHAFWNR